MTEEARQLSYTLTVQQKGEDLHRLSQDLLREIDAHSERHDFAQSVDQTQVYECHRIIEGREYTGICVPFSISSHHELSTMNHYIRQCGKRVGLVLVELVFPDGMGLDLREREI